MTCPVQYPVKYLDLKIKLFMTGPLRNMDVVVGILLYVATILLVLGPRSVAASSGKYFKDLFKFKSLLLQKNNIVTGKILSLTCG
jgi:hypothetical protein